MDDLIMKEIDLILDDLELIRRRLEIMKSVCKKQNQIPNYIPYDPSTTPVVSLYACPTIPGLYTTITSSTEETDK